MNRSFNFSDNTRNQTKVCLVFAQDLPPPFLNKALYQQCKKKTTKKNNVKHISETWPTG